MANCFFTPSMISYLYSSFGGKNGFEIAGEAFLFHVSQVKIGHYEFTPVGDHDNTAFGLYYTAVGPDTGLNDFMENID